MEIYNPRDRSNVSERALPPGATVEMEIVDEV
jgi:hypothetical protein